jgi:hypothetical protein
MSMKTARNKRDVFDPSEPATEFQNTSYVLQKNVLFDVNTNAAVPMATCANRADGVVYIVGSMAFGGNGAFMGKVDGNNGNELIPGTAAAKAPAKAPAPPKAPAKAPAKKTVDPDVADLKPLTTDMVTLDEQDDILE